MKPTWTRRRPAACSASTIRRQSSASVARGFSQKTGLPAAIAASTCSAWVGPHDVTRTASTSGCPIRSAPEATARAPARAATSAARAASRSVTATTSAPVTTSVRRRTWSWPIMPAPITPTRTVTAGSPLSVGRLDGQDGHVRGEQQALGDAAQHGLAHRRTAFHADDQQLDLAGVLVEQLQDVLGDVDVRRPLDHLRFRWGGDRPQPQVRHDQRRAAQVRLRDAPGEREVTLDGVGDGHQDGHQCPLPAATSSVRSYRLCSSVSRTSSERPRVSGTYFATKLIARTPRPTKMKNVVEMCRASTSTGKVRPMAKLVSHSTSPAMPMPKPRSLSGKISESISQVTGEIAPCWKARNVTVSPRTTKARPSPAGSSRENTPISSNAVVVPIWPIISIGRRLTLPSR